MIRFNYRPSILERLLGRRPTFSLDRSLRSALTAVVAALIVVTIVSVVEARRLADLDAARSAMRGELAVAARDDARVERLARTVTNLRDLRDALIDAHYAAVVVANTIVRIGNDLPSETWLTDVRISPAGAWSVSGRSTGIEHVGAILETMGHLDPTASTELVSLNEPDRGTHLLDFVIASERTPRVGMR